MSHPTEFRASLLLSAQRALLGAVTQHLRAVTIGYDEKGCTLRGYFDAGASDEEKELLDVAMTEMVADFPNIERWEFEAVDRAELEEMEVLDVWVYRRHERNGV
ncbi:MAG: hypothetical protein EOO15_13015 [Chitinophagaceae bacterium]|nr:MAG: hypothetical protein EOO15_13015 [Chitinophagaceae bacterium]